MRPRRPAAPARHGEHAAQERSLSGGASFVGSFPRADEPLDPSLPEVALIGRSNVGKSSLLNSLLGHKLARVSASPGKTRLLNVYGVERGVWGVGRHAPTSHTPQPASHAFYLLDLPGYGWARASKTDRAAFLQLLRGALLRPRLAGVVWLLDLRHDPSADDRVMQDTLAAGASRVLAAFTKADKLPRGQRLTRARALQERLALDQEQVVTTSAVSGEGIDTLREAIAGLIAKAGT